jgi:hypothetical protein
MWMAEDERPAPTDELTVSMAAKAIGVTRQDMGRLVQTRRLKATRMDYPHFSYYVIRRGDLDEYVATRRNAQSTLPPGYEDTRGRS